MRAIKLISIALFYIFINISCKKREVVPSRVQFAVKHTWTMTKYTVTPAYPFKVNGQTVMFTDVNDYYSKTNQSCRQDVEFNFEQGSKEKDYQQGKFNYFEGRLTCAVGKPLLEGYWLIDRGGSGADIFLYLLKEPYNGSFNSHGIYKIEELSEDTMELSYTQVISGSAQIYTFKQFFTNKIEAL